MNGTPKTPLIVAITICIARHTVLAHDIPVHMAITANAAASAAGSSLGYFDFLNTITPDLGSGEATNALVLGSALEDNIDQPGDAGGKRSMNHFYDPLTRLGLSNIPPDDRIAPMGRNSFDWSSLLYCPGVPFYGLAGFKSNLNTHNDWSWQNAREYEWRGLTAVSPAGRHDALTNMFRAVGQVIHLLEDTSQPQHVRNEQHLDQFWKGFDTPWRSAIEDYGAANIDTLNYEHAMLDWKSAGFTKVEDFWNRRKYGGQDSSALVTDAATTSDSAGRVGLAEFSNGNFLGARHLFPEYSTPGKVDYYPFPSRDTSTDYKQVKANPPSGINNFVVKGVYQGKGIYLHKNADGADVPRLCRLNYLGVKVPGVTGSPFCTIRDDGVLEDYHHHLIRKAVKYSAGLIDYFFRGRLDICITSQGQNQVGIQISNLSGQDLNAGSFRLFWDDASGTRTEITGSDFTTAYVGSLADNATTTATFVPPPGNAAVGYVLVYSGTIGFSGGKPNDPVDESRAIAAKKFALSTVDVCSPCYTGRFRIRGYTHGVIGVCPDCELATEPGFDSWDGTFGLRDIDFSGFCPGQVPQVQCMFYSPASFISGMVTDGPILRQRLDDACATFSNWQVSIACADSEENFYIAQMVSDLNGNPPPTGAGASPEGIYHQVGGGCTAGPATFTIEAYVP